MRSTSVSLIRCQHMHVTPQPATFRQRKIHEYKRRQNLGAPVANKTIVVDSPLDFISRDCWCSRGGWLDITGRAPAS